MSLPPPRQTEVPRICILGGGFGGLYCALALPQVSKTVAPRRYRYPGRAPGSAFLFTPLLYELLTEELQPWEIAPSYSQLLGHTDINVLHDWAEHIDPNRQRVELRYGDPWTMTTWWWLMGSQIRTPTIKGGDTYALPFANLAHELGNSKKRLAQLEREKSEISVILIGGWPPTG